jgi:hypothetical protein
VPPPVTAPVLEAFVLDPLARVLLAVVFLSAVAGKLRSPRGFAEFRDSVAAIAPRWLPVRPVAGGVVVGEAATVVLLAAPATRLAGYTLAAVLLAAFCVGIARVVHSRQTVRCQCFGAGGDALGRKHLVRNSLLIAVAAAGALDTATVTAPVALTAATAGALLGLLTTRWEDVTYLLVPTGRNR